MAVLPIPEKGIVKEEIMARMRKMRSGDADWKNARSWALVYHADDGVSEVAKAAYNLFFSENALNPMAFPSLKRMENEVIAMTAAMLGGDEEAAGNMTSGGTESILMAVKSAKQRARAEKPEITSPEIILPVTAHPAFHKAAYYFDVKPVLIPCGEDGRADAEAARAAINRNTALMVGSAPCFPFGVVDPIGEMAAAALEKNVNFHVDACLGGFMLPFLRKLGYVLPDFDFSVPGVTSISADLHKYGYAAKGASAIIYKNSELRMHQYYAYADWSGGIYASPTMTGTRPGGAIAAAWAVLNYLGVGGYMKLAEKTMEVTKRLLVGIDGIPELRVVGKPDMSVFCFNSDSLNIHFIGDAMESRGWMLDRAQRPAALHLIVTPNHEASLDAFIEDLRSCIGEVSGKEQPGADGMAAIYGLLGTLPDRNAAENMVLAYLDDLFKYKPEGG